MSSPILGNSSVLAVITHHRYEAWLPQCLESIVSQSQKPDAILVVDDASPQPPVDIVEAFPSATLMTTDQHAGPNRILQAVFDHAVYDAYLIQDADDWSSPDRLAVLLREAERSGAEMVGCQAENVFLDVSPEPSMVYPADARDAVLKRPASHPVLMSASLLGRDLVRRLGGLATGLQFGADNEFIRRAVFAGK